MTLIRKFWPADRSLSVLLVSLILVIFVIQPLGDLSVTGRLVMTVFFSLILVSGVGSVSQGRLTTTIVSLVVFVTLTVRWTRVWTGVESLIVPDALFSVVFCAVLAVVVLAQVFRDGPITSSRIQGAVAVYLLFGLTWAYAYELVDLHWPNAFVQPALAATQARTDLTSQFVYFSFVTLTTAGYGDVTAVHPVARSLVTMEVLVGQLFPAVLLSRLVSMEVSYRQMKDSMGR